MVEWDAPLSIDAEGAVPVNTADATGGSRPRPFLSSTLEIQGELEMVLRSNMENLAEHIDRAARAAIQPPVAPSPPSTGRAAGSPGRRHNLLAPLAARSASMPVSKGDEGSDTECHGEDDEVPPSPLRAPSRLPALPVAM